MDGALFDYLLHLLSTDADARNNRVLMLSAFRVAEHCPKSFDASVLNLDMDFWLEILHDKGYDRPRFAFDKAPPAVFAKEEFRLGAVAREPLLFLMSDRFTEEMKKDPEVFFQRNSTFKEQILVGFC